ncbi:hypothetical protein OUZ56_012409 [Daphnia magna]|uniref:Uncharacterized protein n=1 Tax=Daphnia magna TaxID=35525 RepID=A0ABQ9Z2X1_9CRUS|nr:hypothetical protein OUZ56_012409 [Daphnia magna]
MVNGQRTSPLERVEVAVEIADITVVVMVLVLLMRGIKLLLGNDVLRQYCTWTWRVDIGKSQEGGQGKYSLHPGGGAVSCRSDAFQNVNGAKHIPENHGHGAWEPTMVGVSGVSGRYHCIRKKHGRTSGTAALNPGHPTEGKFETETLEVSFRREGSNGFRLHQCRGSASTPGESKSGTRIPSATSEGKKSRQREICENFYRVGLLLPALCAFAEKEKPLRELTKDKTLFI